jgi:CrcB protein
MSIGVILGVGLLGGVGALARFLLDGRVGRLYSGEFPLGTLAVNLSGAFALGLLVGLSPGSDTSKLLGTGLLGAYTTFSTWMLESERLGEEGELGLAALNVGLSLGLGLGVAWLGRKIGTGL